MQSERSKQENAREGGATGRRCDLCGNVVPAVRRVALDREYDRLQLAHKELYACEPCASPGSQAIHLSFSPPNQSRRYIFFPHAALRDRLR